MHDTKRRGLTQETWLTCTEKEKNEESTRAEARRGAGARLAAAPRNSFQDNYFTDRSRTICAIRFSSSPVVVHTVWLPNTGCVATPSIRVDTVALVGV